jgi:hypothetical protein
MRGPRPGGDAQAVPAITGKQEWPIEVDQAHLVREPQGRRNVEGCGGRSLKPTTSKPALLGPCHPSNETLRGMGEQEIDPAGIRHDPVLGQFAGGILLIALAQGLFEL